LSKAKAEIIGLPPFSIPNLSHRTNFAQVNEDTQHSIFLQKEIENFTTEMKTDKDLTSPGNAPITHRVHDQRRGPYFNMNFLTRIFFTKKISKKSKFQENVCVKKISC